MGRPDQYRLSEAVARWKFDIDLIAIISDQSSSEDWPLFSRIAGNLSEIIKLSEDYIDVAGFDPPVSIDDSEERHRLTYIPDKKDLRPAIACEKKDRMDIESASLKDLGLF